MGAGAGDGDGERQKESQGEISAVSNVNVYARACPNETKHRPSATSQPTVVRGTRAALGLNISFLRGGET